jgi:hypothetical protein
VHEPAGNQKCSALGEKERSQQNPQTTLRTLWFSNLFCAAKTERAKFAASNLFGGDGMEAASRAEMARLNSAANI